jgi:alcohol dehydrogenase, propanol-preferring
MLAMVLAAPAPIESRPLQLREMPDPEPGPGEVRLRVRACGLCRTDLHQVEGELPMRRTPVVPGHQAVGVIDRIAPGTGGPMRIGDRVGLPWLHSTCSACPSCAGGEENLCPSASFTGYDHDGGYAQFVVAPEAFVLPLPDGFDDLQAAPLLCAGIIGYRALRIAGVRPGETVGLYGFGASAHVCLQLARFWQCRVFVITRAARHREFARELGAAWAGTAAETPPAPLDRAILFAPAGALVPRALECVRAGGTVALAGIFMDGIPALDYERHLYREKVLRSVTAATRRDARELLALAARIPLRTEVEIHPLAAANEALQRLKASDLRAAGVLEIP